MSVRSTRDPLATVSGTACMLAVASAGEATPVRRITMSVAETPLLIPNRLSQLGLPPNSAIVEGGPCSWVSMKP